MTSDVQPHTHGRPQQGQAGGVPRPPLAAMRLAAGSAGGRRQPAAALRDADGQAAGAQRPERASPAVRPGLRLIDACWAGAVLIAAASAALTILAWGDFRASDAISNLGAAVSAVAYASLGRLIVRRAGNPIGWLLLIAGVGSGMMALFSGYGVVGIITHPGALPAARLIGAPAEWAFFPVVAALACMLLLFPTGTLPSRRWRPVALLNFLATGLLMLGFILVPRVVVLPAPGGYTLTYRNPFGIPAVGRALSPVPLSNLNSLSLVSLAFLGAGALSLVQRYREGGSELRRQINWVALAGVAFVVVQLVAIVAILADHGKQPPVAGLAYAASAVLGLLGFPAAITVGILKYRLYDIDVIISRAVVYGLLSAAFTGVYVGVVFGIGTFAGHRGGPVLTVGAAIIIAVLFQPLRHRFQQLANRLVYGQRATPYQVLSDFAEDMAEQLDFTEAVDRMVAVLAGATGAKHAAAWVRAGHDLQRVAAWPHETAQPAAVRLGADGELPDLGPASRGVAVRHGGELLGALSLTKSPSEPVTSTEDKLLRHLASQAGLVLRNAALTADLRATIDELRASRRRLVGAQDAERCRIERNLHDGAQQQLIALRIQLGLLDQCAGDAAAVRQMTPVLRAGLQAALDDLRDLARGIYPPLLAEQGLDAALCAQMRRIPLPVVVEADGIGRYPPDTESTVYFCALEGVQNIVKYAQATQATIRVTCPGASLSFSVSDDGAGFDPAAVPRGSGLQGMADRLAALGGTLHIESAPGRGTLLTGQLPVPPAGTQGEHDHGDLVPHNDSAVP